MKERPILMSAPMVRACLRAEKPKTQTRRVVKPQPCERLCGNDFPVQLTGNYAPEMIGRWLWPTEDGEFCGFSPYGVPGDRLWVRETIRAEERSDAFDGVRYLADGHWQMIENTAEAADKWLGLFHYGKVPAKGTTGPSIPGIHMPRWACRLVLEVEDVRIERLNDISEADARAEGYDPLAMLGGTMPQEWYAALWDSINGAGAWAANPWVWCISFRRVAA